MEEASALGTEFRLPFDDCYFEFDGCLGVLAMEFAHKKFRGELTDELIADDEALAAGDIRNFGIHLLPLNWLDVKPQDFSPRFDGTGTFDYYEEDDANSNYVLFCEYPPYEGTQRGGRLLAGVLTLLNERLVASEYRPDPQPDLTAARMRRGRLPLSSASRVLTINTAAVRRIAIKPEGTHESPRLHWRRGHWRILHRYSEFESRTWVRRCLVGDPDRGSVHKDYRLVWSPPMLADNNDYGHSQPGE
jgi:hypothetical protein